MFIGDEILPNGTIVKRFGVIELESSEEWGVKSGNNPKLFFHGVNTEEKGKSMNRYDQEYFYTAEPVYKSVTKEEFDKFIENYPRELVRSVYAVFEPPIVTYNDFELANHWPYSVIARTYIYDEDPKERYYEPEEMRSYTIAENFEEMFDSKTGNMIE